MTIPCPRCGYGLVFQDIVDEWYNPYIPENFYSIICPSCGAEFSVQVDSWNEYFHDEEIDE